MSNAAHKLASELMLRRLHLIYQDLPASAQQQLYDAVVQFSGGDDAAATQAPTPDPLQAQPACDQTEPQPSG